MPNRRHSQKSFVGRLIAGARKTTASNRPRRTMKNVSMRNAGRGGKKYWVSRNAPGCEREGENRYASRMAERIGAIRHYFKFVPPRPPPITSSRHACPSGPSRPPAVPAHPAFCPPEQRALGGPSCLAACPRPEKGKISAAKDYEEARTTLQQSFWRALAPRWLQPLPCQGPRRPDGRRQRSPSPPILPHSHHYPRHSQRRVSAHQSKIADTVELLRDHDAHGHEDRWAAVNAVRARC